MSAKVQIKLVAVVLPPSQRAFLLTRTTQTAARDAAVSRDLPFCSVTFSTALLGNVAEWGSDNIRSFCHTAQYFGPRTPCSLGFSSVLLHEDTSTWFPQAGSRGCLYCSATAFRDVKSLRKRNKTHSLFHLKINQLNERKQGRWLVSCEQHGRLQGEPRLRFMGQVGVIVPIRPRTGRRAQSHLAPPWAPEVSAGLKNAMRASLLLPILLSFAGVWPPACCVSRESLLWHCAAAINWLKYSQERQYEQITTRALSMCMRSRWYFPLPWF